jgi:transposase
VTNVGMESTGVYWLPVYAVLDHFELIVGNARDVRNVPGRKTDVKDSEWISDLVRHGLTAKRFVPPRPLREMRELLHYRRKLVKSQVAEPNRLLKLLKTANKLASVMCDIFGVFGVDWLVAAVLIAEIGIDMSVFVSAYHRPPGPACVPAPTRAPASRRAAERGRAIGARR